ncbi:MAG: pur operon repressor [Actinomycetia bacterium]|nr:pur operon repressor [Actinomycetes bacterium]
MRDRLTRLVALTRLVTARPGDQPGLQQLAQRLGVAKSTLSEDLAVVRQGLRDAGLGDIVTQVGAAGGIRFEPAVDQEAAREAVRRLCRELEDPERQMGNGFIYMTDLLFDPALLEPLGGLLGEQLRPLDPRHVITVETKGIPLALAVARHLGLTVVLLRRDHRLSEGSSLSINYLSGSSHRIQSMSLARRAPLRHARVVFVDDFLKAGGTARAAGDLVAEFGAEMVGVGVLVATTQPTPKLVQGLYACLEWDESRGVQPAPWVVRRLGRPENAGGSGP